MTDAVTKLMSVAVRRVGNGDRAFIGQRCWAKRFGPCGQS